MEVHTTFFDLLWRLKRELEHQGVERVDMPDFIVKREYRLSILEQADVTALEPDLQRILPELLEEGALDIARQIPVRPGGRKTDQKDSAPGQPVPFAEPERRRIGIRAAILVLLVLASVAALTGLSGGTLLSAPLSALGLMGAGEVQAGEAVGGRGDETARTEHGAAPVETLFRMHGSNTIGETLAPELLMAFARQEGGHDLQLVQGDVEVERDILFSMPGKEARQKIELRAHGSSTGFEGLLNREADLAMSSRRIKREENARLAPAYGDLMTVRTEHVVGMDGLAIIVHPHNPIDSLNTAQLARLFSGDIRNWGELGGPDEPVRIYSRDDNSGTWDSFKNMVLKKHGVRLAADARRFESSMELSAQVSRDPGAIGFIGLPYVLRAKALAIADEEGALPVFPTSFTVSTEDYPLSRRLYIYEPMTLGQDSPAHRFIRFVTSAEGQEIVRQSGFISQNIQRVQPALNEALPAEYLALVRGKERLSLNFRFNSGTFELDNKAQRDLERVIRFFELNPGQQAFLIGFSDSIGDPEFNRQLSLRRAQVVRDQLLARGIPVTAVHGLGVLAPVASNATRDGRERNRRVEVWVHAAR